MKNFVKYAGIIFIKGYIMRVPPVSYSVTTTCKKSLNLNKRMNIHTQASFKAAGHNAATAGAGILSALVGAAVGFCFGGPVGAFAGGAILGGLSADAQESENNDLDRSDTSTMFDGREESSRI